MLDEAVVTERPDGNAMGEERSQGGDEAARLRDEKRRLKVAEERVRMLERERLAELREAAAARAEIEKALAAARESLATAEARIAELEEERDEIRALLEKFLTENWKDLTGSPAELPAAANKLLGRGGAVAGAEARGEDGAAPAKEEPSELEIAAVEDLEAALRAGAILEVQPSFRRFEPVKTSHIRAADWLASAHDWAALTGLAKGEMSEEALLEVLFLFVQRSLLRVHSA